MNDKNVLMDKDAEQAQHAHAPQHKPYGVVIAAVVCLLLALVVWVGVMNTYDTDYIPVRVVAPDGYTCELSADGVEVDGTVATLRGLKEIVIPISAEYAEFVIYLGGQTMMPEAMLQLPDGVQLTRDWSAVLTVTKP